MFTQRDKNNTILVSDVMISLDKIPVIKKTVILKEALEEMGRLRLGIACIVDSTNKLLGILTDGDFRRKLLKVQKPFSAFLIDDALKHAILSPVTVQSTDELISAVNVMGQKQVWDLPVVDNEGTLKGLLHLHPAIRILLGAE